MIELEAQQLNFAIGAVDPIYKPKYPIDYNRLSYSRLIESIQVVGDNTGLHLLTCSGKELRKFTIGDDHWQTRKSCTIDKNRFKSAAGSFSSGKVKLELEDHGGVKISGSSGLVFVAEDTPPTKDLLIDVYDVTMKMLDQISCVKIPVGDMKKVISKFRYSRRVRDRQVGVKTLDGNLVTLFQRNNPLMFQYETDGGLLVRELFIDQPLFENLLKTVPFETLRIGSLNPHFAYMNSLDERFVVIIKTNT